MNKRIIIILVSLLFVISGLRHLSYPLFWNDEAETIMHSRSVNMYGYPKVHVGKNTVYMILHPDKDLGKNKKYDAYTGIAWGMFYMGAIADRLASLSDDLYTKTFLARLPFLLLGFFSLWMLLKLILPHIKSREHREILSIVFLVACLLSVSLGLHIREVRYYSLVIFITGATFWVYFKYRYLDEMAQKRYWILLPLCIFLAFNIQNPLAYILVASIGLNELYIFLQSAIDEEGKFSQAENLTKQIPAFIKSIVPLIASVALLIPCFIFFGTFKISAGFSDYYGGGFPLYIDHLLIIGKHLLVYEFFGLFLLSKLALFILSNQLIEKRVKTTLDYIAGFLWLFFIVYWLMAALIPIHIYVRYFFVLIPILPLMIGIEFVRVLNILDGPGELKSMPKAKLKSWLAPALILIVVISSIPKVDGWKGRIQEMMEPVQGSLDYIIPYIKEKYPKPEELVIATNYEETAFMYYLGSKVTFGYVMNDLELDKEIPPDIISYRKPWAHVSNPKIFKDLLTAGKFGVKRFPIKDYPTNNIPDISNDFPHLFTSRLTDKRDSMLVIYERMSDGEIKDLTIKQIEEAIQSGNATAEIYYQKGNIHYQANEYAKAMLNFRKAIKLAPQQPQYHVNKGIIHYDVQQYDSASLHYRAALSLSPEHFEANFNYGLVQIVQNDFSGALATYSKCITLNQGSAESYYQRAVVHFKLKQFNLALSDLNEAEKMGLNADPKFKLLIEDLLGESS